MTELSRMLSGHPGSDAAREHARELLDAGRRPRVTVHHGAAPPFDYRGRVHRSPDAWRGVPKAA